MEEDHISVACRIRPRDSQEFSSAKPFFTIENSKKIVIDSKVEQKSFTFDYIADDTISQEDFFNNTAVTTSQACLQGFNGSVIFYGQTGTGKTYSAFGGSNNSMIVSSDDITRGLVPRSIEYIFDKLNNQDVSTTTETGTYGNNNNKMLSYNAKCAFYEIYQEKVFDLLNENSTSGNHLQVREEPKKGVFIDGITEENVTSVNEVYQLLMFGYKNRHVGQTAMNRDSSRSHAIFTISLRISQENDNKIIEHKYSKFNFVDLAGSERQKDTHATGERLKEASLINKSLSTLGNVISSLSTSQNNRVRHICYRDSKLTFLLRDSLGGNTKTVFIATLSPSLHSLDETISTLRFAQRVKTIRNVASVNAETTGTVTALQKEIDALKLYINTLLQNNTGSGGVIKDSSTGVLTNMTTLSSTTDMVVPTTTIATTTSSNDDQDEVDKGMSDEFNEIETLYERLSTRLDTIIDRRAVVAIEQLSIMEQNNVALAQKLDMSEKVGMGLKMKIKMRDAELQRYKTGHGRNILASGGGSNMGGTLSHSTSYVALSMLNSTDINDESTAGLSTSMPPPSSLVPSTLNTGTCTPMPLMVSEEQMLSEINMVREETKNEWLKYKLAFDEIVRRLPTSTTAAITTTTTTTTTTSGVMSITPDQILKNHTQYITRLVTPIWTQNDEMYFKDALSDQLKQMSQEMDKLNVKLDNLRHSKCEELFGFSYEEGIAMKDRIASLETMNQTLTQENDELIHNKVIKSKQFELALQSLEQDVHNNNKSLNETIAQQKSDIETLQCQYMNSIEKNKEYEEVIVPEKMKRIELLEEEKMSMNTMIENLSMKVEEQQSTQAVLQEQINILQWTQVTSNALVETLEMSIEEQKDDIIELQHICNEYETQIQTLQNEVQQLTDTVTSLSTEKTEALSTIEFHELKIHEMEIEIKQYIHKAKYSRILLDILKTQNETVSTQLTTSQQNYMTLLTEKDQLNNQLYTLTEDMSLLQQTKTELSQTIESIEIQLLVAKQEYEDKVTAFTTTYETQIQELSNEMTSLQTSITTLTESLNTLSAEKEETVTQLEITKETLSLTQEKLDVLQVSYDSVQTEMNQLQLMKDELLQAIENADINMLELQNDMSTLKVQLDEKDILIDTLVLEKEQLNSRFLEISAERDMMMSDKETLNTQYMELSREKEALVIQVLSLESTISEKTVVYENLSSQYLTEKDELIAQVNTLEVQKSLLESTIDKQSQEYTTLKSENDSLGATLTTLETQKQDLEKCIQELSVQVTNIVTENVSLVGQLATMEVQKQELEQSVDALNIQVNHMVTDNDNLTAELTTMDIEKQDLKTSVEALNMEITNMVTEKKQISDMYKTDKELLSSQLRALEQDKSRLMNEMHTLKANIEELHRKNMEYTELHATMEIQLNKKEDEKVEYLQEINDLQQKINDLESESHASLLALQTKLQSEYTVQLECIQSQLSELIKTCQLKDLDIEGLNDTINTMKVQYSQLQEEILSITHSLQESQTRVNNQDKTMTLYQDLLTRVNTQLAAVNNNNNMSTSIPIWDDLDQVSSFVDTIMRHVNELKTSLTQKSTEIHTLQIQVTNISQQMELEKEVRKQLQESHSEIQVLKTKLHEVQDENSKLSGHNNNKQKIHHLMQLKKELEEQSQTIKSQRDRIIEIVLERDALKNELDTYKTTTSGSSSSSSGSVGGGVGGGSTKSQLITGNTTSNGLNIRSNINEDHTSNTKENTVLSSKIMKTSVEIDTDNKLTLLQHTSKVNIVAPTTTTTSTTTATATNTTNTTTMEKENVHVHNSDLLVSNKESQEKINGILTRNQRKALQDLVNKAN